ncbi:MAG TPA: hypothetical protein VIW67_20870 [Terriglobales bacterium]|jgi:hypothetical protein
MQRTIAIWLLAISMTFGYGLKSLYAQEETKAAAENDKAKSNGPAKPLHAYRVDFSITELAEGKKVNTRHYSMVTNSGPWSTLKIGTRVPVATGSYSNASAALINTQFQYLDVGTNIDCQVDEQGEDLSLIVRSEFSNLSSDDEQRTHQPIIRQIQINGRTITSSGKLVVIGAVDDPTSNRQYQLEAVVTKLK